MHLRQIIIVSIFLSPVIFSSVRSTEKTRSKRTLNYFFEGLFNAFSDKRNYKSNSRASNDHRLSAIATLAKLSSVSTQPKKFNALDENENSSEVKQSSTVFQLPIPKKSQNEHRISNLKRMQSQDEVKITTEANKRVSSSSEQTEDQTIIPTTIVSIITTQDQLNDSNVDTSTLLGNFREDELENTTEYITFKSKMTLKKSDRHTTQFFNGPLIVERHHDDHQHNPKYCKGVKCQGNGSKEEIHPYLSPNFRDFLASLTSDESISKSQKSITNSLQRTPIIYLHQPYVQFHTALH